MGFRLFLRCSALVVAGLIGSPPGISAATIVQGTVKAAAGNILTSGTSIFPISENKLKGAKDQCQLQRQI